jgi:hypothetical protein
VLESPPDATNAVIQPALDGKKTAKRHFKELEIIHKHAIVDVGSDTGGASIIPILPSRRSQGDDSQSPYSVKTNSILSPLSKVIVQNIFSFDLAFVKTVHKAQGQTIPHVIHELDYCPVHYQMQFNVVLYALSRVSHTDHMIKIHHRTGC